MGNFDPRKDLQGLGRDFPFLCTFSNCFHLSKRGTFLQKVLNSCEFELTAACFHFFQFLLAKPIEVVLFIPREIADPLILTLPIFQG